MNCANKPNIDETFIINSTPITPILPCSAVTTDYIYSCNDETLMFDFTGNTINPHVDIVPSETDVISLGTSVFRFRDINTNSGTSTVWTSTGSVITPVLDLGNDSLGNPRVIDADSSIIQDDTLFGGDY